MTTFHTLGAVELAPSLGEAGMASTAVPGPPETEGFFEREIVPVEIPSIG
ncbi:MAG: hypothetical protein ACT4QA_02100 [Panacagrimonas sp.]